MRYRRFRQPSKSQIFGLLMTASVGMVFVPPGWLRPAGNMTQLTAVFQWATRETTQKVADGIRSIGSEPVPADEHARTVREKDALANEIASLRQKNLELQSTIDTLTHIRRRGFPANGTLIPARVVAADAAAARESLLLSKGSMQKVKQGDWVASRLFVEAGSEDGVRDQLAVLAHECLIGWIEQATPFTSRVVLLSDPLTNKTTRVRVMPRDSKRQPLTANGKYLDFALSGEGRGKMQIHDIPRDFVEAGRFKAGDLVTSDPGDPRLPMAMVIGQIEEIRHNRTKPVYYDATVAPLYDPQNLSQVFVVDLSTAARAVAAPVAPAKAAASSTAKPAAAAPQPKAAAGSTKSSPSSSRKIRSANVD